MTDENTDKTGETEDNEQPETRLSGQSVEAIADALHEKQKAEKDTGHTESGSTNGDTGKEQSTERHTESHVQLSESDHKGIAEQLHKLQESEKPEPEPEPAKDKPVTKPNPLHFLDRPLFRIGGRRASNKS